jgi:small GTP-binding protein
MDGTFDENQASSKNVQIQRKILKIESSENEWAQVHVWDTLGQEEFKAVAPLYYRKSVGAFLVYDCTNRDSFNAIDEWYGQISSNIDGARVIVMLLGNKCDLPNRVVTFNEGMEFARQRNFGFLEVSAKTGTNVRNSFYCLVRGMSLFLRNISVYVEIWKAQMRD